MNSILPMLALGALVVLIPVMGRAEPVSASTAGDRRAYDIVHDFQGTAANPLEGQYPYARLISGEDGYLYGTTQLGGSAGGGTAYRVDAKSHFETLHSFSRDAGGGIQPIGGLLLGSDGQFYGATNYGGEFDGGTVFRMSRAGTVVVLHSFGGGGSAGGLNPSADLVQGRDGALYGTTKVGGAGTRRECAAGAHGCGTVFRINAGGDFEVLHSFNGGHRDGSFPAAGLTLGRDGSLYGTTTRGGRSNLGTIFTLMPSGQLKLLHSFNDIDGNTPYAPLIQARNGMFYGTTFYGGESSCGAGCGLVYRISSAGNFGVVHRFSAGPGGSAPEAPLFQGPDGALYGTTFAGGGSSTCFNGCGTVFKLRTDGSIATLHAFEGGTQDGGGANSGLFVTPSGLIIGATYGGGSAGFGTLFALSSLRRPTLLDHSR